MSASGRVGVEVVVVASLVTVVPTGVLLGLLLGVLLGVLLGGTELLELLGGTELLELLGGTELLELLDGGTELLELELLEVLELLELLELLDGGNELLELELLELGATDDGATELVLELDTTDDGVVSVSAVVAPATGPANKPSPARARPNPATTAPTFVTRSMATSRLAEPCRTPLICQYPYESHCACRNDP